MRSDFYMRLERVDSSVLEVASSSHWKPLFQNLSYETEVQ